jgi:hypothetical protein
LNTNVKGGKKSDQVTQGKYLTKIQHSFMIENNVSILCVEGKSFHLKGRKLEENPTVSIALEVGTPNILIPL